MTKILVIDSDAGMQQITAKMLEPAGYKILKAEEGTQSLEIYKNENPDLILLDVRLPDMDSSEILVKIKQINQKVPIIILSGLGDSEAAEDLIRMGASDVISKPFKTDAILGLVNKNLGTVQTQKTPENNIEQDKPAIKSNEKKLNKKSKFSNIILIILIIMTACFAAWYKFFKSEPSVEFDISYSNPSAVCAVKNNILIADWAAETLFLHNKDKKFTLINNFKVPDIQPTGLAFDGKFIWMSHSFDFKIYKCSLSSEFKILEPVKIKGFSPSSLFFDGENLWSIDFQGSKIYKHKMDNLLTVEAVFESPAVNPCGIFCDKKYFYVADAKTGRIYRLKKDTFLIAGIYTIPLHDKKKIKITGMGWDGKYIWTCSDGIQKIYRHDIRNLKKIKF